MNNTLKEISGSGFPSDFLAEVKKSAFHIVVQGNNSHLNIESIIELDNIVDLNTQNEKLSAAERIFKNITPSIVTNKNNEDIYL